jgi:hypothetical protein
MTTIAITGHRRLNEPEVVRAQLTQLLADYKARYPATVALSALAAGADSIFAEEAIKLQIPLRYVLPFELNVYEEDFSVSELSILRALLAHNQQAYEIVSTLKDTMPEAKNEAYMAVGKRLVDECDVLVAVWDGQPAAGKGGTGDVVAYARRQGKVVHIIPATR